MASNSIPAQVLALRPGDVLLVTVPDGAHAEHLARLQAHLRSSLLAQLGFSPLVLMAATGVRCEVLRRGPGPLGAIRDLWAGLAALGRWLQRRFAEKARTSMPIPVTAARAVSDGIEVEFHVEFAGSWWKLFQVPLVDGGRSWTEEVVSGEFTRCVKARER